MTSRARTRAAAVSRGDTTVSNCSQDQYSCKYTRHLIWRGNKLDCCVLLLCLHLHLHFCVWSGHCRCMVKGDMRVTAGCKQRQRRGTRRSLAWGLGSTQENVSGIFCQKQKGDKKFHIAIRPRSFVFPLHFCPGLSPCNLSPINVVCLIVSVDLDPGYQMVARYCGVTCHVSRAVMTRASTQSPRRACTLHVKLLCMYQPR